MTVFIAGISSDIGGELAQLYRGRSQHIVGTYRNAAHVEKLRGDPQVDLVACDVSRPDSIRAAADRLAVLERPRSEEHTSELQSHVNLVCRLLLEKKKT